MSIPAYQFVVLTEAQFDHLKNDLGWDIGAPRTGPDESLLTNRNGNVPFSESELAHLVSIGAEVIPSSLIGAWLTDNGWEE